MKTAIFILCVIVMVEAGTFFRDSSRKAREYTGCYKPEDEICVNRTQEQCNIKRVRQQCPRKCGVCAPFNPKCPKEYPFGCCWNGNKALDIKKSNCPQCKNIVENYCSRPHIKKDCDFESNTEQTRNLCPVTCGACNDYGFEACDDKDARCAKMEDTTCCESSEILQDLCRKTCGICA